MSKYYSLLSFSNANQNNIFDRSPPSLCKLIYSLIIPIVFFSRCLNSFDIFIVCMVHDITTKFIYCKAFIVRPAEISLWSKVFRRYSSELFKIKSNKNLFIQVIYISFDMSLYSIKSSFLQCIKTITEYSSVEKSRQELNSCSFIILSRCLTTQCNNYLIYVSLT